MRGVWDNYAEYLSNTKRAAMLTKEEDETGEEEEEEMEEGPPSGIQWIACRRFGPLPTRQKFLRCS